MTTGLSDRLRKTRRAAVIATGITLAAFQLCGSLGLRINISPSLPMGLYVTTADASAKLVEFCPAEPFATLSRVRGYRAPGTCGDGADPLLKPVVAKAGDVVEVSALGISVNGYLLHNTAPLSADSPRRPLASGAIGRPPR
jgi:conjugative transfer signal peptidase TraF